MKKFLPKISLVHVVLAVIVTIPVMLCLIMTVIVSLMITEHFGVPKDVRGPVSMVLSALLGFMWTYVSMRAIYSLGDYLNCRRLTGIRWLDRYLAKRRVLQMMGRLPQAGDAFWGVCTRYYWHDKLQEEFDNYQRINLSFMGSYRLALKSIDHFIGVFHYDSFIHVGRGVSNTRPLSTDRISNEITSFYREIAVGALVLDDTTTGEVK